MPRARSADLSAAEARRVALTAQGFGRPRPSGRVTARHFQQVLERTGLVQLDPVNVLARAHYMPFYSRLGGYDRAALDRFLWGSGRFFEYWGHAASLIPIDRYPLFRHRMQRWRHWSRRDEYLERERDYVDGLVQRVRSDGPVQVGEVNEDGRKAGWWEWSDAKIALEALYTAGRLAIGNRRSFARLYDVPERVVPAAILDAPHPDEAEAYRALLLLAAQHHGVATLRDLADYYRLDIRPARQRLAELVEAGAVEAVTVEGWKDVAYLLPGTSVPRRLDARALLSPFDPVIWERARTERLFDFHYRIEIYVPEAQRKFGYYVLPFLLGDRLAGRVDLKADRQASTLIVRAAHVEAGEAAEPVADALADELRVMQQWLGLERMLVEQKGDLAPALAHVAIA